MAYETCYSKEFAHKKACDLGMRSFGAGPAQLCFQVLEVEMKVSQDDLEQEFLIIRSKFQKQTSVFEDLLLSERLRFNEERQYLLEQIFETQEDLAQHLLKNETLQLKLDAAKNYISRVYSTSPSCIIDMGLKVSVVSDLKDEYCLKWELRDLFLGERYFSLISFKTIQAGDMVGIVFERSSSDEHPPALVRWPNSQLGAREIHLTPVYGSIYSGANEILTSLGTTDWDTLSELVSVLVKILSSSAVKLAVIEVSEAHISGLRNLQTSLRNWPAVLRFDSITVKNVLQQDAYNGLELYLVNVTQGGQRWPELRYRISSVDGVDGTFGYHPRIEFPVMSSYFFDKWVSDRGTVSEERFELRFSLPDDMDVPVWRKLSEIDKIRVASLISSLPIQLGELHGVEISHGWGRWIDLCLNMKRVLSEKAFRRHTSQ